MSATFIFTAFVMGLAGGPHCIAMCGAACGMMHQRSSTKITFHPNIDSKRWAFSYLALSFLNNLKHGTPWSFYLGRLLGYASLGALAAFSVKGLAWFSGQTAIFQAVWTFFHAMVFAYGLMLLIFGQSPTWAERWGRRLWQAVSQYTQHKRTGYFFTGVVWALMPCGLLYSALLFASLQADWLKGALSMLAFALGSGMVLAIGPTVWTKLRAIHWFSEGLGMRLTGIILIAMSLTALWMDIMHHNKLWCNTI